ncbi:hypothetical protein BH20ACT12_BH20ACT12_18640 [soil metagenome]
MSRSGRVYSILLLAYPREFRRRYRGEMEQLFLDLYRERRGSRSGLVMLWIRTLSDLVPTAVALRIMSHTDRREAVMQDRRLAVVGFVLLLAPLYFVSASLLKYGLGVGFLFDPLEAVLSVAGRREVFNLISPVVFLGGLCLALALNVYAATWIDVSREDGTIVSSVRLGLRLSNLAVAVVSILLLATLLGYAFLENFTYH